MKRLMTIWQFLKPYKKWFYRAVVLTAFWSATTLVPPLLLGTIVDKVIGLGRTDLFWPVIILCLCTPIIGHLVAFLNNYTVALIGAKLVLDMRMKLYQHLQSLPLKFYDKSSTGGLMERMMGDINQVQQMVAMQTIAVISDVVACFVSVAFMMSLNWRLTLLILLIIPLYIANYNFFIARVRHWSTNLRERTEEMSSSLQERLTGNAVVKTFGQERAEDYHFLSEAYSVKYGGNKLHAYSSGFQSMAGFLYWFGQTMIYLLGCYLIIQGEMTLGAVIAFTSYCVYLLGPAVRFSQMSDVIERSMVSVERIRELLDEEPDPDDAEDAVNFKRIKGHVEFKDLHFEYDAKVPVLNGIDLDVPAGNTVALVGETGCGKTTIISLLLRFYRVAANRILIDGVDINKLSRSTIKNNIAMVPQDPILFEGTIRDNLAYGVNDATDEQIIAAAKVAEIHSTIMELEEGYDTVMGEEGTKLSLGEKQRLIIARAIVADPAILILDEATSSLDTESERLLQKALNRIMADRTCFVVAHRLSTIIGADIIVVLSKGRILEVGRHEELLAKEDGHYRQLYLTQFIKVA